MTGSSSALASQPWADWHAPASLQDWVRLQQVVLPPQEVDRPDLARWVIWQGEALTRLHLIDAERLAAAILKRRLAHGMVPAEVLRELSTADHYDSNRRAVDYAHQVTPPLFSQVALGWLALGQGEQAFAVLNLWQSQAESQGKESSTVVIAKQAKIQVARRMRMDKQALSLVEQTTGARYPANAPDVWPLLALTLPPGEPSASEAQTLAPSLCHALSRSQPALTAEGVAQVRILRDALPDLDKIAPLDANAPVDDVSLALDRVEADLVVAGESAVGHMFARQLDPEAWLRSHPDQTEDGLRLMLRALTLNVWNTAPGQTGVARLQDWGARVGQRWLAALALDEGELLAMRLPAHAMHLLDHARHWFLQVDDHAGALIAVTRSAISAIHAQSVQAHAMASQIEPMYAQLVRRLTGSLLPAWPELLPRQVDQQSVFAAALYSDWGGWLNRLRLLQAWAAEPGPPGSRTALVENALRTIYGPRLPLEMDLTLTDQAKAGAPSDVSVRPIAAAAVASVNTARVEDTVFGLEITLASDSSIATQTLFTPIQVRIRLQEHARQWPGQGALAVRAEGLGAVAALQAYETAARDIPTAIVHTLHAVRQERGQRSLAIPLTVHAGVAALPWEALLTLAVAPPRVDDWEELFQFWRVSEVGMPVRAESVPAPVRPTVMSLGDRAWIRMVETGWSPLQGVYNMATSVSEAVRLLLRSPVTVLHLIGTPVRTASGLRLQVQGRSRAQQAIQTVEASVRGVDTLAGAESLLPGGVGLVVLQAEPAETTLRFDTEREYTADLRALAAEFFRAGAPAVIMLPALPSGLGMRALRQIASGLAAASATNVKPLLDAVSRTRAVIASHDRLPWETSFPGEEAPPEPMPLAKRLELALDVCLFIDSLP